MKSQSEIEELLLQEKVNLKSKKKILDSYVLIKKREFNKRKNLLSNYSYNDLRTRNLRKDILLIKCRISLLKQILNNNNGK